MRDISLHLLDLMENSLRAEATDIRCELTLDEQGVLSVLLADNGRGMDANMLSTADEPFTTSRTTRKVGLGLPLTKANALKTGGTFRVDSTPGAGTQVTAAFHTRHLDCLPLGSLEDTLVTLVAAHPLTPEFTLSIASPQGNARFSTQEIRQVLGDNVPLNEPEVLAWMRQSLFEQVQSVFGGLLE